MNKQNSVFSTAITFEPNEFNFNNFVEIRILASNDDLFVLNHIIRMFTVEVELDRDVFEGTASNTMEAKIEIIEDGKFCQSRQSSVTPHRRI